MKINFKELKQYIEKELQAKKFLAEGLDAVSQLDTLDGALRELTSANESSKAESEKLKKQLSTLKGAVNDAEKDAAQAKDNANAIIAEANNTAKAIEKQARDNAREILDNANGTIAKGEVYLRQLNTDIATAQRSLTDVNAEVSKIQDAKNKLLEKLSA